MKNVLYTILLILFGSAIIFVGRFFFWAFIVSPQMTSYTFYTEIEKVAYKLKEYKKFYGSYPPDITSIGANSRICVKVIYTRCRSIFYKPSSDLQNFTIAMKVFPMRILFYHPEVSFNHKEYQLLGKQEQEKLFEKYGAMCFYCEALPEDYDLRRETTTKLIYRKTFPLFANPEEWSEL